jgi:dephospho-CoA kinase
MLRVGLTGGIACGKSHVLRRLAARGLATLDLDGVAHELMAPGGAAYADVAAAFGPAILAADGSIDRRALGALVFADPAARGRLDALVHPRVRAEEGARARALAAEGREVLVSDGALLVEAGVHLRFDRLVVVHCPPEEQVRRLVARDGIPEEAARARLAAQMPIAEKRAFAHLEIETLGTKGDTDRAADDLARELDALARRSPSAGVRPERLLGGLVHGPAYGPRGLSPDLLLAAIAQAGGLEMEALARRLSPPASAPWYRAADVARPDAPAALLGVALAAWSLRRASSDAAFLASTAASVARLTHRDPAPRADACLFALVAREAALEGIAPGDLEERAARLAPLASRWGGGAPSPGLRPVWVAVRRFPAEPEAARAECAALGGEPALAGALAGFGAPVESSARTAALRGALLAVGPREP